MKLAKEILMGNFIFCSLRQVPVLGLECQGCEFITSTEGSHYCICENEEYKHSGEEYSIKELINILLDELVQGKMTVSRDELENLLSGNVLERAE